MVIWQQLTIVNCCCLYFFIFVPAAPATKKLNRSLNLRDRFVKPETFRTMSHDNEDVNAVDDEENNEREFENNGHKPEKMFTLKKWNAVAMWSWDVECDTCAICRVQVMGEY